MRNTKKSIWQDKVFLSLMAVCLLTVVVVSTKMIGKAGRNAEVEESTSMEELAAEGSLPSIPGENGKILVEKDTEETEDGIKAAALVPKEYNYGKDSAKSAAEEKITIWDRSEQKDTAKQETKAVIEPETTQAAADADASVGQSILQFDGSASLVWPIQGELLRQFAMDHTVYHATLQQYKVSPAVIIQAEVGTTVTTPAVGLVEELGWNEEIGNYLRINLGNEYQVILGQLENITVQAGQYVAPGNELATVAAPTRYYSKEGPNVYFELRKGEAAVDPEEYLK